MYFIYPNYWDTLVSDGGHMSCYTVEPHYLELAYFELPLISKWKSGPCFNMKLWQQVKNNVEERRNCSSGAISPLFHIILYIYF